MPDDPALSARITSVQDRIYAALHEPVERGAKSRFSSYMPGATVALQDQLLEGTRHAAVIEDIERILDTFARLRLSQDVAALQHALTIVLTHHPALASHGLRMPSLEERSAWKTWPSRRE